MDGQHRVGAVRMLHNQNMYAGRVLVEMFSLQSEAEVAELFTDINKAEPVRGGKLLRWRVRMIIGMPEMVVHR